MVQLEQEFARRQPEAKLEVEYLRPEKVYAAVLADEADLGLGELSGAEPRNHRDSLAAGGNGAGGVALSRSGGERGSGIPRRIKLEDLNGVDFIGFDDDLPIRRDIDRFLREHGIEVNQTLHFDNMQMIKEAVAHRVGVSIMPARIMRDEIAQGRLVAIPHCGAGAVPAAGDYSSQEEALPSRRAGILKSAVRAAERGTRTRFVSR